MAKKKTYFSWSPLRALMKKSGATIVSRDAVALLMDFLELRSKKITESALSIAKHSKRKKISEGDIELAIDLMKTK